MIKNTKNCTRVQDFCTVAVVYWPDKKEPGQPKKESLSREAHQVSYNIVQTKSERGYAKIDIYPEY